MYGNCKCDLGSHHVSHNAKQNWELWECRACGGFRWEAGRALEEALQIQRAGEVLRMYQHLQSVSGRTPRVRMSSNKVRLGPDMGKFWDTELTSWM